MNSKKNNDIYFKSIDNYKLKIEFKHLTKNLYDYLQKILIKNLEGKCNKNGLLKIILLKLYHIQVEN